MPMLAGTPGVGGWLRWVGGTRGKALAPPRVQEQKKGEQWGGRGLA